MAEGDADVRRLAGAVIDMAVALNHLERMHLDVKWSAWPNYLTQHWKAEVWSEDYQHLPKTILHEAYGDSARDALERLLSDVEEKVERRVASLVKSKSVSALMLKAGVPTTVDNGKDATEDK